ncbi:MAG: translation initiation factor IF-5A [Candidatus Aenigmatarchaeota archaeon]
MEPTETKLLEIKKCRPGSFVLIEDEPSTVTDLKISKPGKHGEAKARLEGIGIFDGQKRVIVKPADHNLKVPIIQKKNAQVLSITGNSAQLMDMEDYSTYEVSIPDEFKDKIIEGGEVIVWKFGNKSIIKGIR